MPIYQTSILKDVIVGERLSKHDDYFFSGIIQTKYYEKMSSSSGSESSGSERIKLSKDIGLLHAISIMSGIMIGSGIFVSPVSIIYHCGSVGLALLVWFLSGLLLLFVALCYAELSGMLCQAGGEYAYFMDILGPLPAFLYAWFMFILVNPAFYALLALTTSLYIFKPFFSDCLPPELAIRIFAIWVVGKFHLVVLFCTQT